MHNFSVEENLNKTIVKLKKKDRVTYDAIMKKIWEVTNSPDIEHYKNLRNPLHQFKRNPTPPVQDWGIARSPRSLGRISKHATILDRGTDPNHQQKICGFS